MTSELQVLRRELEQIKQDNAQLRTQFHHAEHRFRLRSGLALAIVVGAILISPTSRQAIAQSYGVTLQQLATRVGALETKTQFISIPADGEMHIVGTNLHIENGLGATNGVPNFPGSPFFSLTNGEGNLILGYNAQRSSGDKRGGSHNLILGDFNNYSSFGGFVAGSTNEISAPYASVSGGSNNIAGNDFASVSGGYSNTASNIYASVSGGIQNVASGYNSAISGGSLNAAKGAYSSISGGANITETIDGSWAAGGASSPGAFHSP